MVHNILKISLLSILAATLAGCHHDHTHEGHVHSEETDKNHHEHHSGNGVEFSVEMQQGIDFAVSPAELRPLGNVIRTVAQVMPAQGDELMLTAKVEGVIGGLSGQWSEGMEIKAGQTLCVVDAAASATDNLRVKQAQAVSELERAKREFERVDALHKDRLVLESEWLKAHSDYEKAEAEAVAVNKGYGDGCQKVTATKGGYLVSLSVANGQHVAEGDLIATVSQGRMLQLKAEVPARYYKDLKHVSDAIIRCGAAEGEVWNLEQLQGRMLSYGRQISGSRPMIPVTFEVLPNEALVVGSWVDIYIQTEGSAEKVCVPASAILEEMGNYFVYVQEHEDFFEKRQVGIGVSNGQYTEILRGLSVGEKVVSRGAVLVKLQQSAGAVDPHAGHSH